MYRGSHTLTHGAFKAALPRQGGMMHIGSEPSIMFKRSICREIKHVLLILFDSNSGGGTFRLKNYVTNDSGFTHNNLRMPLRHLWDDYFGVYLLIN